MSKVIETCCYCGSSEKITRDHVPPKSIFAKPRSGDLISVPACFECNNRFSSSDDIFKTYIGMHSAYKGGRAETLFKKYVVRTVAHNRKLKQEIASTIKRIELAAPNRIYTGQHAYTVLWNSKVHEEQIQRIVKGLFYHHFRKRIPVNLEIKSYWLDQPAELNFEMNSVSICNGEFKYEFAIPNDSDFGSIWSFSFYDAHFAFAIVLDTEIDE